MAKENGGYSCGGMLRGLKSEIPRLSGTVLPGTRPWVLWSSLIKSKQETKRKKREDRKKEGRESGMVGETLAIEASDASHLYGASESSN